MRRLGRVLLIIGSVGALLVVAAPVFAGNEAEVTYYKDVLPILQNNCQTCHRPSGPNISGLIAPMSFMNYQETRPWARAIASKVESREMPPWFSSGPRGVFANERGLSDGEIETILTWVDAGSPAGDEADAPSPREFDEARHDGWSVGTPDFVVKMPEPYFVEDDIYDLNITFMKQLTEEELPNDVWVRGWEFRTGTEGVVHHMCGFYRSPEAEASDDEGEEVAAKGGVALRGLLSCIAEGAESSMLPEGFGVHLQKGSTIAFNMHYHKEPAAGSGVWSQAEIGFFTTDEPVRHRVVNDAIGNAGFEIPPNHPNYRVGIARTLESDTWVLSLWPHAHLRATAARYTATYPDGREELLLDVPRYDQGWQVTYTYREPKLLPKGTRIDVSFWYDNTSQRGAQQGFDPNFAPGHGPRTDDEMALGFIGYAEVDPSTQSNQQ